MMPVKRKQTGIAKGKKIEKKFFQSRDLCLCALDTNLTYAKNVRRNEENYGTAQPYSRKRKRKRGSDSDRFDGT